MRKEHAKNKPNTNKNSSNSKNKKNSNKPKNKLSNRNSMKRKNKPTNWSPSNWKYKNFRKNLPNLSKRKSKDKSPDKACFWTVWITKINQMICLIQKILSIWKQEETVMSSVLGPIHTNHQKRNRQTNPKNNQKFTTIWLLKSTMTKTTNQPLEPPTQTLSKLKSHILLIKWTFSKMSPKIWWKRTQTKDRKHQTMNVYQKHSKFRNTIKLWRLILIRSSIKWVFSPNCLISQFIPKN